MAAATGGFPVLPIRSCPFVKAAVLVPVVAPVAYMAPFAVAPLIPELPAGHVCHVGSTDAPLETKHCPEVPAVVTFTAVVPLPIRTPCAARVPTPVTHLET